MRMLQRVIGNEVVSKAVGPVCLQSELLRLALQMDSSSIHTQGRLFLECIPVLYHDGQLHKERRGCSKTQNLLQPLFSLRFGVRFVVKGSLSSRNHDFILNIGTPIRTAACDYVLWPGPYSVFFTLSRQFFKQLPSRPILLYLGVQFVHVVCHRQQEDLGGYLPVASQQELPEGVVLLNDAKGSL